MIRLYWSLLFAMFSSSALAQSTITLDGFDLKSKEKNAVASHKSLSPVQSQMKSCLLQKKRCKNKEFGNAASFSLEDVVNLGVIDRSKVANNTSSAAAAANRQTDALPTIDIEVLFDHNSAEVRSDQMAKLVDLARLLQSGDFSKFGYAFFGHTDATGSREINQALSQQRAEAVSTLVANFSKLPSERFVTKGFGSSRLKTPSDPHGAPNRRVQLVLVL